MPLFVAADLHLRDHTWSGRPEVSGDAAFALEQIVAHCLSARADLLLLGDTFHSVKPDNGVVRLVQAALAELLAEGRNVYYLLGNHDPVSWLDTSPELARLVRHLPTTGCQLGDHHLYGIDYRPRGIFQEMLANVPEHCDVLACHQRFREAFGWATFHASMGDVPEHVKLVMVGDIHKHVEHKGSDGRRLFYPGSPYLTRVDDDEKCGGMLVGEDLSTSWKPFLSRSVLRCRVYDDDDVLKVVRRVNDHPVTPGLPEALRVPIVIVTCYVDRVPGAGEDLRRALAGTAHVFISPVTEESRKIVEAFDGVDAGKLGDITMQMFLDAEIDRNADPVVYHGVEMLLAHVDTLEASRKLGRLCGLSEQEINEVVPRKG
ncbi:MAG: metallophosphoesterase [Acholeplasmataceae bacterium]